MKRSQLLEYQEVNESEGENDDNEGVEKDFKKSTKISVLLKLLAACSTSEPGVKSIIFSQWTSMLDKVALALSQQQQQVKFVRLDGRMNREKRQISINEFSTNPEVTIMLISLTWYAFFSD